MLWESNPSCTARSLIISLLEKYDSKEMVCLGESDDLTGRWRGLCKVKGDPVAFALRLVLSVVDSLFRTTDVHIRIQ